ncbi:MAG: VOC family protein [Chitinophagales bacterium]
MSSKKVIGVGGIFMKCKDPSAMNKWYEDHLGVKSNGYGVLFEFRNADIPERKEYLQLGTFKEDTTYFEPSPKDFMINFRVEDLESMLAELKANGIQQVGEIMRESYGLFAHIMDPEGNKIELWQPFHKEYREMVGDDTTH